jgi:type IV secretory pathway VirB10-like protein
MSKFGDLIKGNTPAPAPVVEAPAPEPVVEAPAPVAKKAPVLEDMNKKELEKYGRTIGIELDRRHSKDSLIKELKDVEGE